MGDNLILTDQRKVPLEWKDYNGHMSEWHYLEVFSNATDKLMALIGMNLDYVQKTSLSYFTVETHIRHLDEITVGSDIIVKTLVLEGLGKKLRLFHNLETSDGVLSATGEHMLVHVNLKTRSSCMPQHVVLEKLKNLINSQKEFSKRS